MAMKESQIHRTTGCIPLGRTDAAGVIYFASAFEMAHEAIESFLDSRGYGIKTLLTTGPRLPVVHADADFKSPLRAGDQFSSTIERVDCNARSIAFTVRIAAADERTIVTVQIVHACIDASTGQSISIPDDLRRALTSAA